MVLSCLWKPKRYMHDLSKEYIRPTWNSKRGIENSIRWSNYWDWKEIKGNKINLFIMQLNVIIISY